MLLILIIASVSLQGQELDESAVPEDVRLTFQSHYGKAKNVHWSRRGENYLVTYTLDGKVRRSLYEPSGEWEETETDIDLRTVPPAILESLQKEDYKKEEVERVSEVETITDSKYYRVELRRGNGVDTLYYLNDGSKYDDYLESYD